MSGMICGLVEKFMMCQNLAQKKSIFFFFFNDTETTEIYTLSLHDALPICLPSDTHSSLTRHEKRFMFCRGFQCGPLKPRHARNRQAESKPGDQPEGFSAE